MRRSEADARREAKPGTTGMVRRTTGPRFSARLLPQAASALLLPMECYPRASPRALYLLAPSPHPTHLYALLSSQMVSALLSTALMLAFVLHTL